MNVTLIYKWERDPEDIFVYDDGSTKLRRDRLIASDDDAAAISYARKMAEDTDGRLVAVTIGSGDTPWAMARGAKSGVTAENLMPSTDNAQTAKTIAQVIKASGDFDLVIMGNARDFSGVAGTLAALFDIPLVAEVESFEADPANARAVIAYRKVGKTIETLRIAAPALITVAAVESEKDVPSIKQMLAAKKAPLEKLQIEPSEESQVVELSRRLPESHRATIFEGDAAQAVEALMSALRAEDVL